MPVGESSEAWNAIQFRRSPIQTMGPASIVKHSVCERVRRNMHTYGFNDACYKIGTRCFGRYATEIEGWREVREIDSIEQLGSAFEGMVLGQPAYADLIIPCRLSSGEQA